MVRADVESVDKNGPCSACILTSCSPFCPLSLHQQHEMQSCRTGRMLEPGEKHLSVVGIHSSESYAYTRLINHISSDSSHCNLWTHDNVQQVDAYSNHPSLYVEVCHIDAMRVHNSFFVVGGVH